MPIIRCLPGGGLTVSCTSICDKSALEPKPAETAADDPRISAVATWINCFAEVLSAFPNLSLYSHRKREEKEWRRRNLSIPMR